MMAKYFFGHAVTRNWTIPTGTTTMRLENINLANYLPQYIGRSFWSFFGHFAYFDHLSTSFCLLMGISFFFSLRVRWCWCFLWKCSISRISIHKLQFKRAFFYKWDRPISSRGFYPIICSKWRSLAWIWEPFFLWWHFWCSS